jgi:type IV pilus assembly protein PilV
MATPNMNNPSLRTSPSASRGFSLLEVLIAILIAAFGLLGVAGLQAYNLKHSHGSNLRALATMYAYDISDKIRANKKGFEAGSYDRQQGTSVTACYSSGCSAAQMAQMDVHLWKQALAAALPGGDGIVCVDSTPNDGTPASPGCETNPSAPYAIKIWWNERDGSGNLQRFTTAFRP